MGNNWMHWENLPDISCKEIMDNETWNTCPHCRKDWKNEVAVPNLLHRTKACMKCTTKGILRELNERT